LEKARRKAATPRRARASFGFDEEAHPRAEAGAHEGKYKGGQFVPKETAGGQKPAEGPIRDEEYTGPRYTYGLSYRPAGYSHMPDGWIVGSEKEHPAFPSFGTVDYPRPLTDEEVQSFQLDTVHEQVPGGLSQKDMMITDAVIREWQKTRDEWSPEQQAQIQELIDAWDAGPRALADYLRATQETNDFSYTLLSHVKLPAEVREKPAAEKPAVVATYENEEDGTRVHVAQVPKGFSVSMQDVESGEYIPQVSIYPTREQADAAARKAARVPEEKPEEPAKAYRSPYRRGSLEHAIDRAKHRQADHPVYIYPTREGYRWADTVPPGISQYVVVHPGGQVETIKPDFGEAPSMEQLRQLGEDTGEGHEEPEEAPETPAWQMHPSTYQERQGVHEPWIAEISPMQLGMMGDRQRAAYQKKRAGEWAASGQAKTEWRRKIMEAHDAGTITRDSPDLHPEAKRALLDGLAERQKSERQATFEEAVKANGIGSMEEISVGDRLFDTYSSSYGTVTKKNRSSVKFRPDRPLYRGAPEEIKVGPGSLYRKSYDDLQREHGLAKSLLLPITLPSPTLPQLLILNPAKGVTHAG
jgi:hypothetical protein